MVYYYETLNSVVNKYYWLKVVRIVWTWFGEVGWGGVLRLVGVLGYGLVYWGGTDGVGQCIMRWGGVLPHLV